MPTSSDEQFLRRALDLTRQGIGLASPNPHVGAVIVDQNQNIVGTGIYTYAGVKHAEILALAQAGERARGATLYINLEPHSHQGRTPPCTDALISAGISRVVASMADPNPKVSGSGFEKLRTAGIQVEVGQLEAEARRLNEAFARYIRTGLPLVTLKSAMTLDGKIAPSSSTSAPQTGIPAGGWITGEAARAHVHEQRHESDAILAGVGTILADDPLLTDRSGKPRRRSLLRVILDSHLRLPLNSRLVQSATRDAQGNSDVVVFYSSVDKKTENKRGELAARGIRVERVSSDADGRVDIREVVRNLGLREITSLMIEGGATVNAAALSSEVIDKIFLYYAPTIMADPGAVAFVPGITGSRLRLAHFKNIQLHCFGDDIAIEADLRDPYTD